MRTFMSVIALLTMASAAWGEMYTWKDRHGTVFYTNSLHEIPARYLKKARVLDVATGKKGGLVAQQPPGQAGAALQAQPQPPDPANSATAPMTLPPPMPQAPVSAATADPAAGSAQPPAPAAVAAPPPQTRVVLPRRPHRHPREVE